MLIEAIKDESPYPYLIASLGGEELFMRSFPSDRQVLGTVNVREG